MLQSNWHSASLQQAAKMPTWQQCGRQQRRQRQRARPRHRRGQAPPRGRQAARLGVRLLQLQPPKPISRRRRRSRAPSQLVLQICQRGAEAHGSGSLRQPTRELPVLRLASCCGGCAKFAGSAVAVSHAGVQQRQLRGPQPLPALLSHIDCRRRCPAAPLPCQRSAGGGAAASPRRQLRCGSVKVGVLARRAVVPQQHAGFAGGQDVCSQRRQESRAGGRARVGRPPQAEGVSPEFWAVWLQRRACTVETRVSCLLLQLSAHP